VNLGLDGRTALVLGSTSGLGLAIAQGLAGEGAQVVICGRRGDVAAEQAAALPAAIGLQLDLSQPGAAVAAVVAATERFGQIDILVLNAGGPPPGPAAALRADALGPAVQALLLAQIELVSEVLPGMRVRGWGRILAIGSSSVEAPRPGLVQSNPVRAALAGYLKTLAAEVAADGVTVNLILPGRIQTGRVDQLDENAARASGTDLAEVRRASQDRIPMRRYGTPGEFGSVGVFLCSDQASYVTGTAVRVDGGMLPGL
jgi:3-oxoacyl-[acyl-carrier protein] reductase